MRVRLDRVDQTGVAPDQVLTVFATPVDATNNPVGSQGVYGYRYDFLVSMPKAQRRAFILADIKSVLIANGVGPATSANITPGEVVDLGA